VPYIQKSPVTVTKLHKKVTFLKLVEIKEPKVLASVT
jgi:hypothetical protein